MNNLNFKRLIRCSILVLVTLIFIKCEKDAVPFLSVNSNNIEVSNIASTQSLVVSASGSWSSTVNQGWVKLTAISGNGTGNIIFDVDENPTTEARSASITITSGDGPSPQVVVVNQKAGTAFLKTSRSQLTFPAPGSMVDTVKIISNTSWTVSSNQAWLSVTPTSGSGNSTLTLNAQPNSGTSKREAVLAILGANTSPAKNISILQNPRVSIVAGGNGYGSNLNQLKFPSSVCVDDDGNIFITDQLNDRVVKWRADVSQGTIIAGSNGVGNALNQLHSPYGIFVDSDGVLFIGDNQNHRIMKWTPGNTSGTVVAGGNGFGPSLNQVSAPDGVYVDANDNIFIAEAGNQRVVKWVAGAVTGIIIADGAPVAFTTALTLDKDGNVYIASGDNSTVTMWAPGAADGVIVAGGNGRGSGLNQLNGPSGVSVDSDGNLFISDQGNDRIVKWAPSSMTGIVVAAGNGKGDGLDQLNSPSGLWLDTEGNIYVADQGNNRIVKWLK